MPTAISAGGSEALLHAFLVFSLFLGGCDLIGQLEFRAGGEILDVVRQVVRRRQRLSANGGLAAAEEGT